MSPKMALKEGSDILVIGRSITESKNPNQTLNQIYSDLKLA